MALFDQSAVTYDQWIETPLGSFAYKRERELLFQVANPQPKDKILEIGCGTGLLTKTFVEIGSDVTGIDISSEMVKIALSKPELQTATIRQGDIKSIPFEDQTFDLVIGNAVLEYVDDPQRALHETMRVVKQGGRLVVGCLNKTSPWVQYFKHKAKADPGSVFRHARFLSVSYLEKVLQKRADQIAYGLYVPPDYKGNVDEITQLENELAIQVDFHEAGYFVVKWDKN